MLDIPVFKFAICDEVKKSCNDKNNLEPEHFLPCKSSKLATGFDVRCSISNGITLEPGLYVKIPLGFRMLPPPGWWVDLRPRSGTFVKKYIHALYGTIDEDFEFILCFCGQYLPDEKVIISRARLPRIEFGQRIGQLVPVERQEMIVKSISDEEYDEGVQFRNSDRGSKGFGSSTDF